MKRQISETSQAGVHQDLKRRQVSCEASSAPLSSVEEQKQEQQEQQQQQQQGQYPVVRTSSFEVHGTDVAGNSNGKGPEGSVMMNSVGVPFEPQKRLHSVGMRPVVNESGGTMNESKNGSSGGSGNGTSPAIGEPAGSSSNFGSGTSLRERLSSSGGSSNQFDTSLNRTPPDTDSGRYIQYHPSASGVTGSGGFRLFRVNDDLEKGDSGTFGEAGLERSDGFRGGDGSASGSGNVNSAAVSGGGSGDERNISSYLKEVPKGSSFENERDTANVVAGAEVNVGSVSASNDMIGVPRSIGAAVGGGSGSFSVAESSVVDNGRFVGNTEYLGQTRRPDRRDNSRASLDEQGFQLSEKDVAEAIVATQGLGSFGHSSNDIRTRTGYDGNRRHAIAQQRAIDHALGVKGEDEMEDEVEDGAEEDEIQAANVNVDDSNRGAFESAEGNVDSGIGIKSEAQQGFSRSGSSSPVTADGIRFKKFHGLDKERKDRIRREGIKPIEQLTFQDISCYNRNQLRAYCYIYGVKRRKKREMELKLVQYCSLFHPDDPEYDVSKYAPAEYSNGPIPRRKVPVTKEQREKAAEYVAYSIEDEDDNEFEEDTRDEDDVDTHTESMSRMDRQF